MANKNAPVEETGTKVTVYSGSDLPDISGDEVAGLGGLGYSEKSEDSLVPILALLQDNSAEVKRQHAKHIEGAMSGDLVVRSFKRIIKVTKEEPLVVQPCGFQHMWVEWEGEVGEGAVVKQYPFDDRPEEAVERNLDPNNPDRMTWVMPNGNRLVDTRYHYVHALIDGIWQPMVIPMAGTNHTVSRQWTGQMKNVVLPGGQKAPAWFRAYGISTRFNSRGAQSWYTYDVDDLGWISDKSVRDAGRSLFESVQQEIVRPDVEHEGASTAADDESPV